VVIWAKADNEKEKRKIKESKGVFIRLDFQ
jgi:hypothetical protein